MPCNCSMKISACRFRSRPGGRSDNGATPWMRRPRAWISIDAEGYVSSALTGWGPETATAMDADLLRCIRPETPTKPTQTPPKRRVLPQGSNNPEWPERMPVQRTYSLEVLAEDSLLQSPLIWSRLRALVSRRYYEGAKPNGPGMNHREKLA